MHRLIVLISALAGLAAFAGSCGGSSIQAPVVGPQLNQPLGPGMPMATPDDIEITEDGKIASASYLKYFADSVNHHSAGRWTVTDNSGFKKWILSNTAASAPKSWRIGSNYYNNEADVLKTNDFSIPPNRAGIRLTFKARWKTLPGDNLNIYWWIDGSTNFVHNFSDGQNPDYPGYTKYYLELPDNFSGETHTFNVSFEFTSDASGNSWGASIDDVAVYQRLLEAPLTCDATDGLPSQIEVSWSHNNQGTLIPDTYSIYVAPDSGGSPGTYTLLIDVSYPTNQYFHTPPDTDFYWYKVEAGKTGYPNSPYSNENQGWADIT